MSDIPDYNRYLMRINYTSGVQEEVWVYNIEYNGSDVEMEACEHQESTTAKPFFLGSSIESIWQQSEIIGKDGHKAL